MLYTMVALVIGNKPPDGINDRADYIIEDVQYLSEEAVSELEFLYRPALSNRVIVSTLYGSNSERAKFIVDGIERLRVSKDEQCFVDPQVDFGDGDFFLWPRKWSDRCYLSVPTMGGCLTWTNKQDQPLQLEQIRFRNYHLKISEYQLSPGRGSSALDMIAMGTLFTLPVTLAVGTVVISAINATQMSRGIEWRNIVCGDTEHVQKYGVHEFVIFKVFENEDQFYLISKVGYPTWFAYVHPGGNPVTDRGMQFYEGDPGEGGYWKWDSTMK